MGKTLKPTEEFAAEIRNKLQTVTTALELVQAGKEVSKNLLVKVLRDLEKIEEIIS